MSSWTFVLIIEGEGGVEDTDYSDDEVNQLKRLGLSSRLVIDTPRLVVIEHDRSKHQEHVVEIFVLNE